MPRKRPEHWKSSAAYLAGLLESFIYNHKDYLSEKDVQTLSEAEIIILRYIKAKALMSVLLNGDSQNASN